ncbi:MAG: class I SAM-dependent methyltransferase [Nannocystis sp.]|nr:class I SAM-dependent methyltransferase [Nannocystis sp.]
MKELSAEANTHRAYVGPMAEYDVGAAHQFHLLTTVLGLREYHNLLEIGCGSLRAGRLLITWLMPDRYCGLEPNRWLIEAGLDKEIGRDLVARRRPVFRHDDDFGLQRFGRRFDYVIAQSIFSHTSLAQMRACLLEARAVLAPQGVFAASFVEGEDDYTGDRWVYPESVAFTLTTVTRVAGAAGLACTPIDWGNQNGQRWVVFHHPEHRPDVDLDDESARRAAVAVARERAASYRRVGVSPADYARLIERLAAIADHPAVQRAMADDPALRAAVHGPDAE